MNMTKLNATMRAGNLAHELPVRLDTWFGKGRSHQVNQDYVLSGTSPFPWVTVADGCSSSDHTDVGARLLSWAAGSCVQNPRLREGDATYDPAVCAVYKANAAWELLNSQEGNGCTNASEYKRVGERLGSGVGELRGSALDATLLMAWVINGRVNISVYGDGVLAIGRRDGSVSVIEIDYSHNAPLYLSYQLDEQRAEQWRTHSQNASKMLRQQGYEVGLEKNQALQLSYAIDDLGWVLLASDGIKTLADIATLKQLNVRDVVTSLTRFKNTTGSYLKRRVKRQLANWLKQGIAHEDDLGLACMLFRE